MDIHKIIGKIPRPKKGFVLPSHKYTGPYNPLHEQLDANDQPIPGQEPYNAVDAISMHHDICYRDNDTKKGKQKCDDYMLHELDWLKPKNLRERIDRKLVRKIIGTKKRLGMGIKWSDSLADELHRPIRKKFQRRKVVAKQVDDIWTSDLLEMRAFSKQNKGYNYLLMVIDVFSKYGWIIPIKRKTGEEVSRELENLFKSSKRTPSRFWTDKGREYYNGNVNALLKKHNIIHYSTENEEKSSVAERWNRTVKRIIWKYFTANSTRKYIDILPALVERYNNTYHRSIKCTPKEALDPEKYTHVNRALYGKTKSLAREPQFHIGEKVRISRKKFFFEKGFTENWSDEVFTIIEVKDTKPPTYIIKDDDNEIIQGSFYEAELQLANTDTFRIEKVLKRRTLKNGKKQEFVKWKGYNSNHNSWINVDDVTT